MSRTAISELSLDSSLLISLTLCHLDYILILICFSVSSSIRAIKSANSNVSCHELHDPLLFDLASDNQDYCFGTT